MDKEKIIQLIRGNLLNKKEREQVIQSIEANKEQKQFFIDIKNIYALSRKSSGKTDIAHEYSKFKRKTSTMKKFFLEFTKYAAIIIVASSLSLFLQKKYNQLNVGMNEIYCPAGQISELTLSDGTKVWLNSASKITYPSVFDSKNRAIYLQGEAYLEVSKNKRHPFFVKTKNMDVKVTGTCFNVEAYNNEPFKTTLVEGSVELHNKNGEKVSEMIPGQMASYSTNKKVSLKNVDTQLYSSWRDGKMTFFNEPLGLIAQKLERWYNVKITFLSKDIEAYRFSSTILKSKPLDQILQVIQLSAAINYETIIHPEGRNEIRLTKQN